ncbi:P-loop containing nucleoside triphosphate hydrolase protein [Cladochytrium replicatum]|nr:P-loop containing nucleoside triphosphate hydrolase protein [Cladochytrium replicatum]
MQLRFSQKFSFGFRTHSSAAAGSSKLDVSKIPRMQRGLPRSQALPGVRHILAVASGKGGVGKSTVSANIAVALSLLPQREQVGRKLRVGLLDADLFGPSIPMMMNLKGSPEIDSGRNSLEPLVNYGIKCMSMGFLVGENAPVVWRGLMVMKAVEQLLRQVDWSDTDVLVIDMPPGTGDTHLSIAQLVPISGALLVSTPQDIALADARKAAGMFRQLNVPILGMVNNMSFFTCEKCHHQTRIFARSEGASGIEAMAQNFGTTVLGELPLLPGVAALSDEGKPVALMYDDVEDHNHHSHNELDGLKQTARIYKSLAEILWDELENDRKLSAGSQPIT